MAKAESDYTADNFLQWFVKEQLEEVSSMGQLLRVVQRAGEGNLLRVEEFLAREKDSRFALSKEERPVRKTDASNKFHVEAKSASGIRPFAADDAILRAPPHNIGEPSVPCQKIIDATSTSRIDPIGFRCTGSPNPHPRRLADNPRVA